MRACSLAGPMAALLALGSSTVSRTGESLLGEGASPAHGAGSPHVFASPADLPPLGDLPDPLALATGARITTREAWSARRPEITALLTFYEYGRLPPAPARVVARELGRDSVADGLGTHERHELTFGEPPISVRVGLTRPPGPGPYPAIIKNEASLGPHPPVLRELLSRGYIVVEYVRDDLDPDAPDVVGPLQAAHPERDAGTIAAWAWGGMRVVDWLVTLDIVDSKKIAVTGHSRGGKSALLHGALDDRVALVNPNGSGAGGAGSYRLPGLRCETLEAITRPERFGYWFHPRLREFAGREDRLPFDQHYLRALVAPRSILSTDASGDLWANPSGTEAMWRAAQPVFDLLGASEANAHSLREGEHDQTEEDWRVLLDFMEWRFFGKQPAVPRAFGGVSRAFPSLPRMRP